MLNTPFQTKKIAERLLKITDSRELRNEINLVVAEMKKDNKKMFATNFNAVLKWMIEHPNKR